MYARVGQRYTLIKPLRALYLPDLILEIIPSGAALYATGKFPLGDGDIPEVRWGVAMFAVVREDLIRASGAVKEAI
jgi:hypothetical protein